MIYRQIASIPLGESLFIHIKRYIYQNKKFTIKGAAQIPKLKLFLCETIVKKTLATVRI